MPTISFQGERGAFSEEAVRSLLGPAVDVLPMRTFDDAFAAVADRRADAAMIPIENSLAGSVHRNYELLAAGELVITGETMIRIAHALIARPGTNLASIRRVHSHPVALAQCQRFFAAHPAIEAVAEYDTAGSVKMLMESGGADEGAIAAASAAAIYGASVIEQGIEDHPENYTRFLLLARPDAAPLVTPNGGVRKTSLMFVTPNRPGSLFRALAAFALRDIDLAKIESRPIAGRPWEYSFYVDVIGDATDPRIARAIDHLGEMCELVRTLGSYASPLQQNVSKNV